MIRKRLYEILQPADDEDKISKIFDHFILFIIVINISSVILESFPNLNLRYNYLFNQIELYSIIIFTVEYLLRLITSDFYFKDRKLISVFKYFKSPMAIVDILAILPFYLPMLLPIDLRVLRILRLFRVLRIFKINRYTKSMSLIGKVIKRKKEELQITIFVTLILLLLSASMIYLAENQVQPKEFPNIIASIWWAIATLTTVGYGDISPVTPLGKVLGGVIALLGIGLVALPTGIISSGFITELEKEKDNLPKRKRIKKIQKGRRKLQKVRVIKYRNNQLQ